MPPLNFGTLARRVMTLSGGRISNLDAKTLLNQKMSELSESYSWSWLKSDALITTKAVKNTGTVQVTNAGTSIVGTGTPFTSTDVGSYIRVALDVSFYRVTAVVGQTLTIETGYAGANATLQAYTLFANIYSLASDCRRILTPVFWRKLEEATLEELGYLDPMRTSQADVPTRFAYRGITSAGVQQIEVWPIPTSAVAFRYSYLRTIAEATTDATVVPIRPDCLTYAVAADVLTTEIAKDPVKNAALAAVVQRYDGMAAKSLAEELYADAIKQGLPASIGGVGNSYSDDYLLSHDVFTP